MAFRGLGHCPHCGRLVAVYGDMRPYESEPFAGQASAQGTVPAQGPAEPPPPPPARAAEKPASSSLASAVASITGKGENRLTTIRKLINLALFLLVLAVMGYYSLGLG